jgi:hypothetical protein
MSQTGKRLILTSFGATHLATSGSPEFFYRMPPADMSENARSLRPDYAALLVAEQVVIDTQSYLRLRTNAAFAEFRDTIDALMKEELVVLEDFDAIIHRNSPLLGLMLRGDLVNPELWNLALDTSTARWAAFLRSRAMRAHLDWDDPELVHTSPAPQRQGRMYVPVFAHHDARSFREESRQRQLEIYLAHVNANLLIANDLGASFYDWYDYEPFYREKFRVAGRAETSVSDAAVVRQLFEASFHELADMDWRTLVRILRDKRVAELRRFVAEVAQKGEPLDPHFMTRTLREVLATERQIAKVKTIASYVTTPLQLIPTVGGLIQKVADEAIGHIAERRLGAPHRWFYLLTEASTRRE